MGDGEPQLQNKRGIINYTNFERDANNEKRKNETHINTNQEYEKETDMLISDLSYAFSDVAGKSTDTDSNGGRR